MKNYRKASCSTSTRLKALMKRLQSRQRKHQRKPRSSSSAIRSPGTNLEHVGLLFERLNKSGSTLTTFMHSCELFRRRRLSLLLSKLLYPRSWSQSTRQSANPGVRRCFRVPRKSGVPSPGGTRPTRPHPESAGIERSICDCDANDA